MGEVEQTFITQFHALPGMTIKEKQNNLFQLLRENSLLKNNQNALDFITANLSPANHLEKIFYIDFLIYFRRFHELYDNFKSGDDITIKKVSKHEWFYQDAYKEAEAEEFVNAVLPTLSFSIKKKVLKKLPVDEKHADKIFDALQKRYGPFLASDFLPKCSSDKVRETMRNHPIKLTQRQLQILYNKQPDLIYVYFEERGKHEETTAFLQNYKQILIYVAQKNPEMFSNLFNTYKFQVGLGRRTTKNYINSQKEKIISKPEDYINILNNGIVVRKLGGELKSILFKNSKIRQQPYWQTLLRHYPKNHRFEIYRTSYNSIHHQKFGENVDVVTEDMLKIISDKKEREQIAKLKFKKNNDETYLKYVTPEYCFEEYMGKINHMRVFERAKFVKNATECCLLNGDLKGLLKICELVAVRFKNDNRRLRETFFVSFNENQTLIDKFTEQHWKFIMEILEIVNHNSEWVFNEQFLRTEHIKFLIKNKQSIKEIVPKYDWHDVLYRSKELYKEPMIFKTLMNELIEIGYVKSTNAEENSAQKYDCTLAHHCENYNDHNAQDVIAIYDHPRILKSAKHLLEHEKAIYVEPSCQRGIEYIICRPSSSKDIQELKTLYFKSFKNFGGMKGLKWFLKYEPETLQNNINYFPNIFESHHAVMATKSLWYSIKKYSFLGLDQPFVELCKLKIQEKEQFTQKSITEALTILDTLDSYLGFLKPYIPTSDKVNLTDTEAKNLYLIQTHLIRFMYLTNSPTKILPIVIKCCKGDYLKYALSSLFSCICKLPENETKPFIEKLNRNKALSVKKHGLHLSCLIYDVDTIYKCLKITTVPPLQAALKYFAKNPSESLWELIETKINNIEKKDLQLCQSLLDLKIVVPLEYKSRYIETLWKLLDKYEDKEIKKTLMTKVGRSTIKNFDSEFVFKIIRDNIFIFEEANDLIANLLIYLADDEKFVVLFQVLQQLKENDWSREETWRHARQKLNTFVFTLFNNYMNTEEKDETFVAELSTSFNSVFSLSEAFDEYVLILSMAFKGESTDYCSKALVKFNSQIEENYGIYGITLLADTIKKYVLQHVFATVSEKIKLCYSLFKIRNSFDDDLLILLLLPTTAPEDTEHYLLFDEIVKALSQSSNAVVQLQFNVYLRS